MLTPSLSASQNPLPSLAQLRQPETSGLGLDNIYLECQVLDANKELRIIPVLASSFTSFTPSQHAQVTYLNFEIYHARTTEFEASYRRVCFVLWALRHHFHSIGVVRAVISSSLHINGDENRWHWTIYLVLTTGFAARVAHVYPLGAKHGLLYTERLPSKRLAPNEKLSRNKGGRVAYAEVGCGKEASCEWARVDRRRGPRL